MTCTASTRHSNGVSIIDLSGRILLPDGPDAVRDAIKHELEQGHKNILLNLGGVDYIDSSGLGALTSSFITVQRLGGRLKLLNPQTRVSNILQVTRLYTLFVTYTDEHEAVAGFA